MEKCTYCVQRINYTRIRARREERPVKDGEILTACQQVCPADALTFGDTNDTSSKVATLKKSPLNYSLLNELGTLPRTTYLAGLRNPNPALARG
jgi:molybdopterin-containing oxidoreductase family iron-sulfur binding subunit